MKIAIVMPVVLQNDILLQTTYECVQNLTTKHDATLFVACNRLHVVTPQELQRSLAERFQGSVVVLHEDFVERTVAGAWNYGCYRALESGARYIAMVANDTILRPDCLDKLTSFGEESVNDLWSGISYNDRSEIDVNAVTDGADFTCFMIRPGTLHRFGMFDPNYRPAYFEDNDYYARIVLGGGSCCVVHSAQFFHHGSMTIRMDAEMAHHVSYWFEKNKAYFSRKWGVPAPFDTREEVLQHYFRHPFNDRSKSLSWFEGPPW